MLLRVTLAEALTSDIRLVRFERPDGDPLPTFEAGAHVELTLPLDGEPTVRKYSLVSEADDTSRHEIAVKRNAHGRGGSAWLHDVLAVGDELEVSEPISEFGVAPDGGHHVLVAGGIGITPMLGLAARLKRAGASYELHYSAGRAQDMAFKERLLREHVGRLHLYLTRVESPRRLDLDALLDRHAEAAATHLYVCGPASLIDALRLKSLARGVPRRRLHFESFGPAWTRGDGVVCLVMTESAIELDVAPGTPLLDAMEAAGAWIPSDCRRGECGACIASYTAGTPIHRDHCLTEAQRAHSFCPCVSWAAEGEALHLQV